MTISHSRLQSEAILILVVSVLVASSSAVAVLVLHLWIDASTLQDWAQHNQTIQQMSPMIRWSIAHVHLIAGGLLAWSLAGIATGLGLLKAKPLARYGVWLWVGGILLWSIWNLAIMWAIPRHTGQQVWQIAAAQQQQVATLLSYAVLALLNGLALYLLWRSERYFLKVV